MAVRIKRALMNDLPCLHAGCFSSARFVARDNRAALAHLCRLCFADLALEEQSFYAESKPPSDSPLPSAESEGKRAEPSIVRRRVVYLVQPGDSPAMIARRCGIHPSRWRELVEGNPLKKLTPDKLTFASLQVGEWLTLPERWEPQQKRGTP
jgi:hypothetical protein